MNQYFQTIIAEFFKQSLDIDLKNISTEFKTYNVLDLFISKKELEQIFEKGTRKARTKKQRVYFNFFPIENYFGDYSDCLYSVAILIAEEIPENGYNAMFCFNLDNNTLKYNGQWNNQDWMSDE
jgi:hypothetical protein